MSTAGLPLSSRPATLNERAREMAADRVRKAKLPQAIRGLGDAMTLLRGAPACPPGMRLAPSPPEQVPLLGHVRTLGSSRAERMSVLLKLREDYGDIVRLRFGSISAHLVSDPELIRIVLQEQNRIYGKGTRGMYKLRMVLGTGLLTNQGESWLRNRRIAQPAFHRKRIASFGDRMARAASDMTGRWKDGGTLDLQEEMMRVTLRIIAETMLGADVTDASDSVGAAVSHVIEDVNHRVNALVDVPPPFPSRRNRLFQKAMDTLDQVVLEAIEARRRAETSGDDLLGMFMDSVDEETGERMDDAQLRDEVMTIFLAGHETTANALAWTLYLLSKNPVVARRLREEVREVLGDRAPIAADARALVYTRQVLEEGMRLYPPAWMIARSPIEDTELGGYFIPKNSLVLMSPYVVQRHPAHWEDPEGFDPDRFAPDQVSERARFSYFPFGAGPRICIGNSFAMMEAQLILATIIRDWRLDLVPGHPVEMEPLITLRPRNGLRMVTHRV